MKRLVLACLMVFSFANIASSLDVIDGFPNGRFLGAGNWRDNDGNEGQYQTYLEFYWDNLRADYAWSDGSATINLSFAFDGYGDFEVIYEDNVIGTGYCMSIQCHYELNIAGIKYEETITFVDGRLYKLGSKTVDGTSLFWDEALWQLEDGELGLSKKDQGSSDKSLLMKADFAPLRK